MTVEDKNRNEISGVYEELKGVLASIEASTGWFDDDGFSTHTNQIIKRIPTICPEIQNIDSYLIKPEYAAGRKGNIINVLPTKAQLGSIIGRLKGLYELAVPEKSDGHTFIQNQSQNQSQTLSMVLDLQEKIISEIPKHAEGTKERGFLEKLKSSLPTIKGVTDVLSIALKIGSDLGLNPATIHKLLGL